MEVMDICNTILEQEAIIGVNITELLGVNGVRDDFI